jgi:REP element-mobilizing transposase RayT
VIEETAVASEKPILLYREEKRYFGRFDELLDGATHGPKWLGEPRVAQVVCEALHNRDGQTYDLTAYCVMSNHLHVVLAPLLCSPETYHSISQIMHVLKGYTAYEANDILGRKGTFWQAESYDHFVRDADELQRIVYYVINNPVKAGLVDDWAAWPWTYWKYAPE